MTKKLEAVKEKGNYDNREEHAGNWRGHMGAARAGEDGIALVRSWCDPHWGTNAERLTITPSHRGRGVKVSLVPEVDRMGWVKGRVFSGLDFGTVVEWLATLDDDDFEAGPTHIYYHLFLPQLVEEAAA